MNNYYYATFFRLKVMNLKENFQQNIRDKTWNRIGQKEKPNILLSSGI